MEVGVAEDHIGAAIRRNGKASGRPATEPLQVDVVANDFQMDGVQERSTIGTFRLAICERVSREQRSR